VDRRIPPSQRDSRDKNKRLNLRASQSTEIQIDIETDTTNLIKY